jgi:hypothetical protein
MKYNGIPDRFRYRVSLRVTPIQQQETRILNVKGKVKGVSLRVSKAINYIKYNNNLLCWLAGGPANLQTEKQKNSPANI